MIRDQADPQPFRPLGPERRHYWLAKRMAKATGVDLESAMDQGELTQQDWASMVTTCRGCAWTQGCRHWLNQPHSLGNDAPRSLPEGCANRAPLANLRNAAQELT
ncbi:DUF6455 family protein [Tropicibacter oceani]|uniref:DUF6455 family protein n=1 Tax=Tropicibacter oceani TaxID=3058420 RepID=A0ABY8QMF6_9RHOB|nr:DUF6455 family protein [Tropicibacter oceani]WGW05118.1 DUF6455 family protein [Tropicibacter oceani]